MAWTDPSGHVYATGEIVTAATLNTYVQANLVVLGASIAAQVVTSETTTSTSYTDLATSGPAVTIATSTAAWVSVGAQLANNTVGSRSEITAAVSGATTIAAGVAMAAIAQVSTANAVNGFNRGTLVALTAGSNVFTCKYRIVTASTGTFASRNIFVCNLVQA
jgi:hypothetical protein